MDSFAFEKIRSEAQRAAEKHGGFNMSEAVREGWEQIRKARPSLPAYSDAAKEQTDLAHHFFLLGFLANAPPGAN